MNSIEFLSNRKVWIKLKKYLVNQTIIRNYFALTLKTFTQIINKKWTD